MTTSKPLSDRKLTQIERGIDNLNYTGDDVQLLINEIRRQRRVFDEVDAAARRVESGLDRVAEQNAQLVTALAHLDAILAGYQQPGLGPLIRACQDAQKWRAVTTAQDAPGATL